MTQLREAAQQALDAMFEFEWSRNGMFAGEFEAEIDALRAALAEEPQSTHSAECYKWHHACAVAEVERFRAALAQQAEPVEPVAWIHADPDKPCVKFLEWREDEPGYRGRWIKTPLYTSSPQRKPLTEKEIALISVECAASHQHEDVHFARAIEWAHGIK